MRTRVCGFLFWLLRFWHVVLCMIWSWFTDTLWGEDSWLHVIAKHVSGYRVNRKLKAVLLNMPSNQVGCIMIQITTCGPLEWPYFSEWKFHGIWSFSGQVMEGIARPKHADDLFEEDKARWIQPGSIVGPWLAKKHAVVELGNCMQLFKRSSILLVLAGKSLS